VGRVPIDSPVPLADAARRGELVAALTPEDYDASSYQRVSEVPRGPDGRFGAVIAIPLLLSGRVTGSLGLVCPPERVKNAAARTFLMTVAGQCALALERARLYDAEREARVRAEESQAAMGREARERGQAEATLRGREEYLRRLVESSPDCIKTLDLEGNILSISESGARLLEIADASSVCGTNWSAFFWDHEETRAGFFAALDTAVAGGTGRFQGFCPTATGKPKWWDVMIVPILGADGRPESLLSTSRDITERRVSEERDRTRLTDIFMQAPAFMAALRGPNHVFEMANPTYYQLVGHRDIIGKPVAEALPEVVEQGFIGLLDQVYETGEPFVGTEVPVLLQRTPEEPLEERFVDFIYQPLRDEAGIVSGILTHGIDLTERKRVEQGREAALAALRESQERLDLALEAIHLGMWELDLRTGELVWSGEQERLYGLERGDFAGSLDSFPDLVHPDDRKRVTENGRRRIADPNVAEYEDEFRVVRPRTGEVRWLYGRARIERDVATGEALRVTGVNLDITERRQAEERERFLADLSERTRGLLAPEEVAWEAMRATGEFVRASRCVFVEVDEGAGTLTAARDWTREGVPSAAGTYPASSFGEAALAVLRSGGELVVDDVRTDARIPEGHRGAYEAIQTLSLVSVPVLRGGHWVGILGINETGPRRWMPEEVELLRKVAELTWLAVENARLFRRTQEDETRFRALIEASSQMIWRTGADGLIVDMPEWRAYTGQSEEAVGGFGWVDAIHPDDRERVARAWQEAFGARVLYEAEYRVLGRDGVYRWFAARGVPLFGENGSLREYIGTWASVDERHRAEEERAENLRRERRRAEQLRQLAEASLVLNSTASLSEMFQTICDKAREIIGAHQSVVSITRGGAGDGTSPNWSQAINAVSLSDKYAPWSEYATMPDGTGIYALVCRENRTLRLTQAELEAHPAWRGFGAYAAEHPPMNGWLAVPLVARDGANLGLVQLSDRYEGEFIEDDEAILMQLAQLASVAIENQRLLEEERRRAVGEALLNQIGDGIRQSLPPRELKGSRWRHSGEHS
jgi:PAS domain S-box-containing protein